MKISEVKPKIFVFPSGDKHVMQPNDILIDKRGDKIPVENPPVSEMKIRDLFACMALAGILANSISAEKIEEGFVDDFEDITGTAYNIADFMLVTRDYGY